MKVIVGLGNPGRTYHGTRHNVGFAAIELLADRHHVQIVQRFVSPADERPAGIYGDYEDGSQAVRLLMPLTMMNESGDALKGMQVPAQDILLICDDVNLPLGTLRLRPEGGAGGHHGMQSCLQALGTEAVPRLRLGVGVEGLPSELHDFVLSPFRSTERPLINAALAQAVEACETWTREGIEVAMNQYNRVHER